MTAPLGVLGKAFALLALTGAESGLADAGAGRTANLQQARGDETNLLVLVHLAAEATEFTYVLEARVAERLAGAQVSLPLNLAREQLLDFLSIQLFVHDLAATEIGPPGAALRRVQPAPPPIPRCLDDGWLRARLRAEAPAPAHR